MARKKDFSGTDGDSQIVEEFDRTDIGYTTILMRHLDRISRLSSGIMGKSEGFKLTDYKIAVETLELFLVPYTDTKYENVVKIIRKDTELNKTAIMRTRTPNISEIEKHVLRETQLILGELMKLMKRNNFLLEKSESFEV